MSSTTSTTTTPEFTQDTKNKIIRQIEFYFSDSNLPRDSFLKGKYLETGEHWVDLSLVLSFKKMRELLGLSAAGEDGKPVPVSEDAVQRVAELLSAESKAVEVDSDKKRVRRTAPFTDDTSALDARTVYVKGWAREPEPTLEKVAEFYSEGGQVEVRSVRLRRYEGGRFAKKFKGTLLVEFASPEAAEAVIAKKPRPEGASDDMVYMPYLEWKAEKEKEDAARKAAKQEKKDGPAKKRAKANDGAEVAVVERKASNVEGYIDEATGERKYYTGLVVRIKGLKDDVEPRALKFELNKLSDIAHVESLAEDRTTAVVRCKDERAATRLVDELKEKELLGAKVEAALLTGDDEKTFWEKTWATFAAAAERNGGRGRGGHKRGRRGGRRN